MPRLSDTLYKSGGARNPNVNLKKFMNYKETLSNNKIRQLNQLGNRVSEKNVQIDGGACREEMLMLMTCWKKHSFQENVCNDEYKTFAKCNAAVRAKIVQSQKLADASDLGVKSDSGKLNPQQANKLLRMVPQPPHKVVIDYSYGWKKREPLTYTGKGDNNSQHGMGKHLFKCITKQNRR